MSQIFDAVRPIFDLFLVLVGFGSIVVIHEAGHFFAARWAGIRVLAFAVGFGPAMLSFRKGLGIRRGSSEAEYRAILERDSTRARTISPTEYRLNWLPFGGYVKMLGQEDLHPDKTSPEPDSYQSVKPVKRMVVISAGVIANIIAAALIFVVVFRVGLTTEPAVIGDVGPDSPAAAATPIGAPSSIGPGLKVGDRVEKIDDERVLSFNDVSLATAMASPGESVLMTVQRPGVEAPLTFSVTPEPSRISKLLEMGVTPAWSLDLPELARGAKLAEWDALMAETGLRGVQPGMTLARVNDNTNLVYASDLLDAVRASRGHTVAVEFVDKKSGTTVAGSITPRPELQAGTVMLAKGDLVPVNHVAGLTPVLKVAAVAPEGEAQGLKAGDIFVRVGAVEFPGVADGIAEIRAHADRDLEVVVRRTQDGAAMRDVPLTVRVNRRGQIGFAPADTAFESALLSLPPTKLEPRRKIANAGPPSASGVVTVPGSRIVSVEGAPVANLGDVRNALQALVEKAPAAGTVTAHLELELPAPVDSGGPAPTRTVELHLSHADADAIRALTWTSPINPWDFEPVETLLKGDGAVGSMALGLRETRRVMMNTYLTFARLFEGSVKVEHLKGPVGIAHLGTRVADRGLIWLLFFLGLISVNLAVVNFLPLPIVDGGQFIFLLVEQVRGKPVPLGVQNAATLAGLVLIGSMFAIVTFNDIAALFGR